MESEKIEVLLIDGPMAERVIYRPDYGSFQIRHDFSDCFNFGSGPGVDLSLLYSRTVYHVHTYGESFIDEELSFWVFPDRGRFVQWESSDLHWAKSLCRKVPGLIYSEWYIGSVSQTAPSVRASLVKSRLAPSGIRYSVPVPQGYVLPIDTPVTRVQEIMNRIKGGQDYRWNSRYKLQNNDYFETPKPCGTHGRRNCITCSG